MKGLATDLLIAFVMGVIVPAAALRIGAAIVLQKPEPGPVASVTQVVPEQETAEPSARQEIPQRLNVLLRDDNGTVSPMDMDEYLVCAVLAEMPASFETEALKAQSVAARTYALRAWVTGGKHGDGSVCTNYACCQAYITVEDYIASGGTEENVEKVRCCVEATSGYVVTYENALIEATYFSCSGGRTEDAAAVWGTDYPYLQAVESPGESHAKYDTDQVSFSKEEFARRLGLDPDKLEGEWLGASTYTDGGGVDTILLCGQSFRGTQIRSLLGLRSTVFTIQQENGHIVITTRGYGHRVGMSQYGADAMAMAGFAYDEILAYYYQGSQLTLWSELGN